MLDYFASFWHAHAERIVTTAAAGVMMVMTAIAGVLGTQSVFLFATEPAVGEDGNVAAWLWGGGAIVLLGMVARTGKWLGDRYEQWQDRFDRERVDRIRAEVQRDHAEEKIEALELIVADLREQLMGMGNKRRMIIDDAGGSGDG